MTITLHEQLLSCLPDDTVLGAHEASDRYGRNLTNAARRIAGAVRPTTAEQVAEVVRRAATNRIALYPISQGNNWGYGSATPVIDDCIVLDLSNMKRIELVDEVGGIFSIEPGVTQQDLFEYLQEKTLDFLVPTTGAGPDASIVGNALERGFGLTPVSDHWAAIAALEAILPDGTFYQSPLLELGSPLHQWGFGPYVDGLFSQGAFGVVVRVHIRLAHRPAHLVAFQFSGSDVVTLGAAVANLQQQGLSSIWRVQLLNSLRLASMTTIYPSENLLLSESEIHQLEQKNRLAPWNGVGVIAGPKSIVRGTKQYVKAILHKHRFRVKFISRGSVTRARMLASRFLPKSQLYRRLQFTEKSLLAVEGEPTRAAHSLLNWRAGASVKQPKIPIEGNSGLLWFCPVVPTSGNLLADFQRLVYKWTRAHGINPLITISVFSPSHSIATISLTFCKSDDEAVANAKRCFRSLREECAKLHLYPYRLPAQFMNENFPQTQHSRIVDRLKQAIDPAHILSPGRYCSGAS